jgi:hypothetical protein
MQPVPLEIAFSRHGADVAGRHRPLCATAGDGSLVLVCQSSGFSRPGAGVLRYSARLSQTAARRSQIEALRAGLDAANAGRSPVRLIIQTPGVDGASSRVHMRADLVGSVAEFDGDAYSVDFVRLAVAEPPPPPRSRRKR